MTVKLWARLKCGACGAAFTANPETVPVFENTLGRWPACLQCWNMRNKLRVALSLDENARPPAYPEDYPMTDSTVR